jgi:hypothetical protein
MTTATRRRLLVTSAAIFFSYAYFYPAGGWNQNSRFDMVRAMLEQHTLRIDAYHENTEDKAISNGHFYSDKAPGLAFLALPAAAATRAILPVFRVDPSSPGGIVAISYFASLFAVAVPTTLACASLFWIALRLGSSEGAATFAALVFGLANPMWAYAVLFWGHALTGACLLFAFAAALKLRDASGFDFFFGLAVGLAAGWATVSEYPALPASAIVAGFAITQIWPQRRWQALLGLAAGTLACVGVLMAYQKAAFGSAIHPSYAYYQAGAFPWMKRGYMGLTYPRPDVMLKLLFGCRRGLFFAAPILAAAPFGLRMLWRQPVHRAAAITAASMAGYYYLFNSAFYVWTAGWSYGPRYMAAGIPLLCVGIAPVWDWAKANCRKLLLTLAATGVLFSLAAVSVTPQPPDPFRCPIPQIYLPLFSSGHLSMNTATMLTPAEEGDSTDYGAFNLGERIGLHGLPSLLPLFALWIGAVVLWRTLHNRERNAALNAP